MAAVACGVRFGRSAKFNAEQRWLALHRLNEGRSVAAVASTCGVHVATVYRLDGPTTEAGALFGGIGHVQLREGRAG